jgi:hypothetical protein
MICGNCAHSQLVSLPLDHLQREGRAVRVAKDPRRRYVFPALDEGFLTSRG